MLSVLQSFLLTGSRRIKGQFLRRISKNILCWIQLMLWYSVTWAMSAWPPRHNRPLPTLGKTNSSYQMSDAMQTGYSEYWLQFCVSSRLTWQLVPLSLTLIQAAYKWMHWATLRRHSDRFSAATSASSQVIPILSDCAPPVCMWTTWTSLKLRNIPVQRLSRYALVIHSYHMPAES